VALTRDINIFLESQISDGQLDILVHDGDTIGVDGVQAGVLENICRPMRRPNRSLHKREAVPVLARLPNHNASLRYTGWQWIWMKGGSAVKISGMLAI
jgi:hypothetical protein